MAGERASVARPASPPHGAPMHGRHPCPDRRPEPESSRRARYHACRVAFVVLPGERTACATAISAIAHVETPDPA